MTQELLSKFTPCIESLTLLPSGGGRFELTVDGTLLYSKKGKGRHPEAGEIARLLEEQYGFTVTPAE